MLHRHRTRYTYEIPLYERIYNKMPRMTDNQSFVLGLFLLALFIGGHVL